MGVDIRQYITSTVIQNWGGIFKGNIDKNENSETGIQEAVGTQLSKEGVSVAR